MRNYLALLFILIFTNGYTQLQFEEKLASIPINQYDHGIGNMMYGISIAGDVDGDGDLDIFNFGRLYFSTSELYINNGSGSFLADDAQAFIYGGSNGDASFIDIENDGDLDLILAADQSVPSTIVNALYVNDGNGNFSYSSTFNTQIAQDKSSYGKLAVGDFDNDGFEDFILTNKLNGVDSSRIYLNDQTGNFSLSPNQFSGFTYQVSFQNKNVIDFNSDGNLDFCFIANDSNRLIVNLNDGAGLFNSTTPILFDGLHVTRVFFEDFNGDTEIDFISTILDTNTNINYNLIGINDGTGNYLLDSIPQVSTNFIDYYFSVDMDGDGFVDLGGINNSGNGIYLSNDGSGSFSVFSHYGEFPRLVESYPWENYSNTTSFDFNHDGNLDIISFGNSIEWFPGTYDVYINDGLSNFFLVSDNNSERCTTPKK